MKQNQCTLAFTINNIKDICESEDMRGCNDILSSSFIFYFLSLFISSWYYVAIAWSQNIKCSVKIISETLHKYNIRQIWNMYMYTFFCFLLLIGWNIYNDITLSFYGRISIKIFIVTRPGKIILYFEISYFHITINWKCQFDNVKINSS